jgi:hypothetical protein
MIAASKSGEIFNYENRDISKYGYSYHLTLTISLSN